MAHELTPQETVKLEFWKKIDMASESEPCDECLAKPVCRLRDQLHKIKVEGKDRSLIDECSLMVD